MSKFDTINIFQKHKSFSKSNFTKHMIEHNRNIHFDEEKYLVLINKQNNIYLNSKLEEFLIYNEIKHNGFCNIINIQTDFKHNYIYKYRQQCIVTLKMFCVFLYLCQ